jgi:hypothetical protein
MDNDQEGDKVKGKDTQSRTSGRKRKQTVTGSDDFFWTTDLITKA